MYRRLKEHPRAALPCVPTMFAAGEAGGSLTTNAVGMPAATQADVQQEMYNLWPRWSPLLWPIIFMLCLPFRLDQAQGRQPALRGEEEGPMGQGCKIRVQHPSQVSQVGCPRS